MVSIMNRLRWPLVWRGKLKRRIHQNTRRSLRIMPSNPAADSQRASWRVSLLLGLALLLPGPCLALTILYFNDAHEIAPVDEGVRGGMARVAGLVAAERAAGDPVLVLFGGDLAGGTLFGLMRGEPIVKALNLIGIDAATFGQHEFDHGVDQARRLAELSEFPWITSNLTETDGQPFNALPRYRVLEVDDLRVGVFGITTAMDTTRHEGRVIEQEAIPSAHAAVTALKAAGVDLIVALTQQTPNQDLAMVRAVPGIDLVLGEEVSETRSQFDFEAGTYLARSAGNVSSLIRARWIGPASSDWQLSVIPVDASAPEAPAVAALSEYYSTRLAEQLADPVRAVEQPWRLSRDRARSEPGTLGELVAEAFRRAMDSDVGFATAGGLRADLIATPPALTLADIAAVLPFDNRLVRLRISGAELRELIEIGLAEHPTPRNRFPLISGITVRFDPEAPAGARVRALQHHGKDIEPDQTLTLATSLFLAGGGDGYTLLADLPREPVGLPDRDALAAWLAEIKTWPPDSTLPRSLIIDTP